MMPMIPLPIDDIIPDILASLRQTPQLVLVAPPGAGKTTRVPPAVLQSGLLKAPDVIVLQPRRVAARAVSARIAEEHNWQLGQQVGYHVRFDRRISRDTHLKILTEGILTRQLLDDPFLDGVGAVILDEFHERSIHADLTLAMLREVQQSVRPDLILIVMSATLDAQPVAQYLGHAPVLHSEGRTFPVEIYYDSSNVDAPIADRASVAARDVLARQTSGDVLVFLPGVEEIRRTDAALRSAVGDIGVDILPLHGTLPLEEQSRAVRPDPNGRQRVILATNIAETSLTIQGVTTVIDSGLARVASFDADRGLDRLDLQMISKASAAQRAGRAGRVRPGECIRLWSAQQQRLLADFEEPEIRRVDLAGTVLSLHAWGKPDVRGFGWYEAPKEDALAAAEELLAMLGALDAKGAITPLGQRMQALPLHPRLARLMVHAADSGLVAPAAVIAAILSERDVFARVGPAPTIGPSDLLLRYDAVMGGRSWMPVDARAMAQVRRLAEELTSLGNNLARNKKQITAPTEHDLLKLPLLAYPDRVCRRRENDPTAATMVGALRPAQDGSSSGGGVKLARESVVAMMQNTPYFLALDARHDPRSRRGEALVRMASAIDPAWLDELFPQSMSHTRDVMYDAQRERVVPMERISYGDLVLSEDPHGQLDSARAAEVLAAALRPRAREIVMADEHAAKLLARIAFLRAHMSDQPAGGWPELDDAQLGDLLATLTHGKRSLEDIRRSGLADAIRGALEYPRDRLLDQHAPESIEVPTGNRIKLDYSNDPPILAVRLQEMFGLAETPRIAAGRVPVLLHLLGPNYRPVQITSDLASFWQNAYFEVRKDLRARYPKHSWPEDPTVATPVAKGRPRR